MGPAEERSLLEINMMLFCKSSRQLACSSNQRWRKKSSHIVSILNFKCAVSQSVSRPYRLSFQVGTRTKKHWASHQSRQAFALLHHSIFQSANYFAIIQCEPSAISDIVFLLPFTASAPPPGFAGTQLYYSCCQYGNNKRTREGRDRHITLLTRIRQMHVQWILSFKTCPPCDLLPCRSKYLSLS